MAAAEYYIGLMSGTSLDGIDAVLADFARAFPRVAARVHRDFPPTLRAELLALNRPGENELDRAMQAANLLAREAAKAVSTLLATSGGDAAAVSAIGSHGQTVRHRPDRGYTLQLDNPALLAELTGIPVVADFRRRDVAAGGQGAPLVPAFHAAAFRHPARHRVIVNIGGIANVTDLPPSGAVRGFDCGPGNVLMDLWATQHLGQPFDPGGRWAASGRPIPALFAALAAEPFFAAPPPKSTGRDLFNADWLAAHLTPDCRPADVQATLLKLTVYAIHHAVLAHCPGAEEVYVCGGGARNDALLASLRHAFAAQAMPVAVTDALGVAAEDVEALAFAWLARETMNGRPGNLPEVTGAFHPCVLGAIYPR